MLKGQNIICIASSSWDAMWVNSQHLMDRLAEHNRVLYVNNTGLRPPGKSMADLRKIGNRLVGFFSGKMMAKKNLFILSPIIIPFHNYHLVRWLNGLILSVYLRFYCWWLGFSKPLLWIFLPTGLQLVGRLGESLSIFHCVDKYSQNPGVSAKEIQAMERELCRKADLVLVTSSELYEEKKLLNSRTHYFGNVADIEHFSKVLENGTEPPSDIAGLKRPIIGYQGNIAGYKVDLELLEQIALKRPEWSLVLIGPVGWGDPNTDVSRLRTLVNVHFLDRKSYEDLPKYVGAFDVCLIPFVVNDVTQNSFPMKFFEYLAAAKPIVSRRLKSLEHLGKDPEICRLAETPEQFLEQIESGLMENQTAEVIAHRLEVARQNDWSVRVEEIGQEVQKALEQRVH